MIYKCIGTQRRNLGARKMKKINIFILLLLGFVISLHAEGNVKPLDLSLPHETTGEASAYFEDVNGSLSLSEILKLPKNAFTPLNKAVSSNGFTDSAFWYRLKVNNTTNSTLSRLIVFEPAWLDNITLTVIASDGEMKSYEGGMLLPYRMRSVDHHLINFKHTFKEGISTIYVRVKTRDPFIFSMSMMDESSYFRKQSHKSIFIGFIFGGIMVIMFYNFFLYLGTRKRYYLYYVLSLSLFILMNATYNGYTFTYLFADHPHIQKWAQSTTIYIFVASLLLFAREFLNLKEKHPVLSYITLYQIVIVGLLLVCLPLVCGYSCHILFAILSVILAVTSIFAMSVYAWYNGNKTVRFFTIASASGLLGAVITILTVMSLIPYTYLTYKAADIGMYLDVLFLSLALPDKMKQIDKEKSIAQKEAKTDALTGLLNLRAYKHISASEYQRLVRNIHPFSVIMIDIDDFKTVNDSYGHGVGDNVLKAVANVLQTSIREYDYAFRRGGDEFLLFLPETTQQMAYLLAERIRREIENTKIQMENYKISVTCSMGISEFKEDDDSLKAVVKRADKALYQAKNTKRNSIRIWAK